MPRRPLWILIVAFILGTAFPAAGQTRPTLKPKSPPAAKSKPGSVRSTTIEIELLSGEGGGLQAQQWRSSLESLEIPLSIRRGSGDEEPETKEKIIGTLRKVTVIGRLERSGRIVFADRSFEPGDRVKLKEWINDLKTFGAQGKPDGRPLWGLNEDQFTAVFESLTEPTKEGFVGQDLEAAVRKLPLPAQFPVRWTEAAKARLDRRSGKNPVRQSTQGFSLATALAILLRDYELGFRPSRTPSGDLELVIDVPETPGDAWPIGWPLKLSRQQAAPKLFALQEVFFDDQPLGELLSQAAKSAEMPVLLDYADPYVRDPEWTKFAINYPPRQASWHAVVKDSLNKVKLTFDLWQDEGGRPFLYVSSVKGKRNVLPLEK